VFRIVREGDKHSVVEYIVRALLEGDIATSYTQADNSVVVATDSSECGMFTCTLVNSCEPRQSKTRVMVCPSRIHAIITNPLVVIAKTSPHVLSPELYALHLGTHFVTKYPHIHKAFITVEQLKWSRIPVDGTPHKHSFVRDGEEKIVVNVEVDGTAGEDKISAKVDSGIKDLLGTLTLVNLLPELNHV
jgi:urate oxidase